MYSHNSKQQGFLDNRPDLFGNLPLDSSNRWVQLAGVVPWDFVEEEYRQNFKGKKGAKAYPARFALGSLIVKEKLKLSDRDTVEIIRENPYIQYFLGLSEYNYDLSLDSSSLTYFRQRFPADVIARINQLIIDRALQAEFDEASEDDNESKDDDGDSSCDDSSEERPVRPNKGTLILDATCAPQDIQYPTDVRLLHEARKKLEELMDKLQEGRTAAKPRNYRKRANREYNRFSRMRRPSKKAIRKARRQQLGYVSRDLKIVKEMQADSSLELSLKDLAYLDTIERLFSQQKTMHDEGTNRCDGRIVSIHQPHVRPIVRGKVNAPVEFGAKLGVSMIGGFAEVDHLSWDAYNESQDLPHLVENYKERLSYYPEKILVDKIYRTRANLQYCKERGILLNGPALGRPSKDKKVLAEQRQLERQDSSERNAVEGKFGEAKRRYGLDLILTRLKETSETQIQLIFLVMNLKKILRDLFVQFFERILERILTPFYGYLT